MTIVPFPPQTGTQVVIPPLVSVRCEMFRENLTPIIPLAERNNGTALLILNSGEASDFTTLNTALFNATGIFTAHPTIGWDTFSPVHGALPRRELVLQTNYDETNLTYPTPLDNYPTPGPDGSGGTVSSISFAQGPFPVETKDHRINSTVRRYWDGLRNNIEVTWDSPTYIMTLLSWDSTEPPIYDPDDPGGSQVRPLRQWERKW